MATPTFNPKASYSVPAFDPSAAYEASPQHDYSSLTANPKGEGTYKITTQDGQTLSVPYSNVPVFTQGLQGTSFASPDEQARFDKDAAADPKRPTFWNALTNPVGSGGREQGVGGGALQVGGQAIKTLVQPFAHPIETVKGTAEAGAYLIGQRMGVPVPEEWNPVTPVVEGALRDKEQGGVPLMLENLGGQALGTIEGGRLMGAAVSGVEPSASLGPAGEAPVAGAEGPVNTVGGLNAAVPAPVRTGVVPAALRAVPRIDPRQMLAGNIHEPIPGTDVTPAQRYQSMKDMGMQPNAAEATNSTLLNMVEKVNQNSLTAAPTYAKARAANLDALNDYAEHVLDSMSPKGPEEGGAAVQQGLRDAQVKLQNDAASGFTELDRAVGNRKLRGSTLQQTAKNIYDANAPYFEAHPSLIPGNAWKIVKDLAGADATPQFQARPMSFAEVHQLRSDLLELVRSNPDIVKNQAGGWLQQLAEAADRTMTTGVGGLNAQGTQVFRDANEAWANMKGTYDNPSHPFYDAVRTQSPSKLVRGIQASPEMAKMLQSALGPEGMGPIQRGVAENLLRTTKEGGYNFKTFQGNWNKLPQAYRDALFTPEQRLQLEGMGDAGTVMHEDANPSGSARLGQGIAEGAEGLKSLASPHELAGNVAYHATHYGLGRLMNSPRFVDWLMKGRGFAPIEDAAPAASTIDPHTGPNGQPNFYSDAYLRNKAAFEAAQPKEQ